jgi:hypothetical protein
MSGGGIAISDASTGAATIIANGPITASGTSAVCFTCSAAGTPIVTFNGLLTASGTGAKVLNVTAGTPVINLAGGFYISNGGTGGIVYASGTFRMPPSNLVDVSTPAYGLGATTSGSKSGERYRGSMR